MSTGIRGTGDLCWINILTLRPAEAMEFFTAVLGWTYVEMPGVGHLMKVGGRDIGGIFDLHGPGTPPGLLPMIGVMIKVESAETVSERIVSRGGTAKPAFDIGDQGRMAVCHDPTGGKFDIWEPKEMHGTDVDSALRGAPCWFELMTSDVEKATEFYCQLFGWTSEVMHMPAMDYTIFKQRGTQIAGMMAMPPQMEGVPPHWGTYFAADDADMAARVAAGLGAKLCVPPTDIPGIGRFCGITSPGGVTFYAITYLPSRRT